MADDNLGKEPEQKRAEQTRVVANLTTDDMMNIVAYTASLP
jgi:hypothetical protein